MADSDDDFFGSGPSTSFKKSKPPPPLPIRHPSPPPRPSTSTRQAPSPPPSPPIRTNFTEGQQGSDHDDDSDVDGGHSEASGQSSQGSDGGQDVEEASEGGSVVTSASEEEQKSEEDPLSDLWDSADNDGDSQASLPLSDETDDFASHHEFVQVRTSRGLETVDLTPPDELLTEAETLRQKYYRKKKADECLKQCINCLALTRIVYHEASPFKLASCHAWLAKAYYELRDWAPQTYDHCEQGLKYLLKSDPNKLPDLSKEILQKPLVLPTKAEILDTALLIYSLMGRSQLAMNKMNEAETNLNKAQTILKERQQLDASIITDAVSSKTHKGPKNQNELPQQPQMKDKFYWKNELTSAMARVKLCQGEFDDAYKNTKKVLRLIEHRFGEHHLKLIPVLKELTKIEHKRGDLDHAAEFAMRAYSIAKADLKETDVVLADTVKFLATAYAKIPDSDQADFYAESYFREAIADYEASVGETDKKTLHTYKALAEHYAARKRHPEAAQTLTQYLPNFKDGYGDMSLKTVDILKMLASQYLQMGELRDAAKHLRKAYETEKKMLGPQQARTEGTRRALDVLLKNPGLKDMDKEQKQKAKPHFNSVV